MSKLLGEKKHDAGSGINEGTTVSFGVSQDAELLRDLGYQQKLVRNRSFYTILFQSIALVAIPYAFGAPLISAVYGGGQLCMFLGWIVVLIATECVAVSLGELTSRYTTAAGPAYWTYQLAPARYRKILSFLTGWLWLIGGWTTTLSVNFGFASLIAACIAMYHPDFEVTSWQFLLLFYFLCCVTFVIVAFGNRFLPMLDTICAAFTVAAVLVSLVCLSVFAKAGRNSAADTLGQYDTSLSGWNGFSFLIGIIPAAYVFGPLGMMTSMAEECADAPRDLPKAMCLCVPVGGVIGLLFILPVCATMPALTDIIDAPVAQALPYIYHRVMGSAAGGLALTSFVLVVSFFCSISITVTSSRSTWAFARDKAIPYSSFWSRFSKKYDCPIQALALMTVVQMLLGLVSLGSTSAFSAFIGVGVIALSIAYAIPLILSMKGNRREVQQARWQAKSVVGWTVNVLALAWIALEIVLFAMPAGIPVTSLSMNYAAVVLVALSLLTVAWYYIHARHVYNGPPVVVSCEEHIEL